MRKMLFFSLFMILLFSTVNLFALPSLTVNGSMINPIRDANDDVAFSFGGSMQEWTLMAEYAGWHAKNNFGYYTDFNIPNPSIIFQGSDSPIATAYTNIAAGTDIGLYMWANHGRSGGDPTLYSHKSFNSGTDDDDYQYFYVYDVSAYRNLGYSYDFNTNTKNFTCYGDYDYLIYVDDSGAGPDYDHNDMIMGVSAVPEPASLFLLGLGISGAGILYRRRKNK